MVKLAPAKKEVMEKEEKKKGGSDTDLRLPSRNPLCIYTHHTHTHLAYTHTYICSFSLVVYIVYWPLVPLSYFLLLCNILVWHDYCCYTSPLTRSSLSFDGLPNFRPCVEQTWQFGVSSLQATRVLLLLAFRQRPPINRFWIKLSSGLSDCAGWCCRPSTRH